MFKRATPKLESVAITLGVVLVGIYCRPAATADELILELDEMHERTQGRVVIAGDFNARHVQWDTRSNQRGYALRG